MVPTLARVGERVFPPVSGQLSKARDARQINSYQRLLGSPGSLEKAQGRNSRHPSYRSSDRLLALAQERLPHALISLYARAMRLQRWVVLDREGGFLDPTRQHIEKSVREGALAQIPFTSLKVPFLRWY